MPSDPRPLEAPSAPTRKKRLYNRVLFESSFPIPVLHALMHYCRKWVLHPDQIVPAILRHGLELQEDDLKRIIEAHEAIVPFGRDTLGPPLNIPDLPADRQEPPFPKSRWLARLEERFQNLE